MSIEKNLKEINESRFKAKVASGFSNMTSFAQSTTRASVLALGLMITPAAHADEAQNTTAESVSDYSTLNSITDDELDLLCVEFKKIILKLSF